MKKALVLMAAFLPLVSMYAQRPVKACGSNEITSAHRKLHGVPAPEPQLRTADDSAYTYIIPVVVHVLYTSGAEEFVDLSQVRSQIDVLNEDYNRYGYGYNDHPDGARVNIRFCLATIDPDGNPTTGMEKIFHPNAANWIYSYEADSAMKAQTTWDPTRYFNIWTVGAINGGSLAGYTYYPEDAAGSVIDGSIILYQTFGREEGTAETMGRTTTHEAGHFLGLYHPWGSENTCDDDDGCDDTPLCATSYVSQPPACLPNNTCGFDRQVENFMDYSFDECQNMFTKCQAEKMREVILQYRSKMVSRENLVATGCISELDSFPVSGEIGIYPNPSHDKFMLYFDMDSEEALDLKITDPAGRVVLTHEGISTGRGAWEIDLAGMPMGLYHLVLTSDIRVIRRTLVLQE